MAWRLSSLRKGAEMIDDHQTILVVDDESHMRRLIEFTLRKGGYTIVVVGNGREAIAAARTSSPDLIILDVLMPEMDGMEALERLKENEQTAAIPVILLTGIGQPAARQLVEEKGTATYLAKPFSPSKLLREVRRKLEPAC